MLILSRKRGESICLPGTNTTITIHRTSSGRVTLAIDAPQDVAILRGELMPLGQTAPLHSGLLESAFPGIDMPCVDESVPCRA